MLHTHSYVSRDPTIPYQRLPSFDALKPWNMGCGDKLVSKRLAVQAQGSEFHPQNPYQEPGIVVCPCNPSAVVADTVPGAHWSASLVYLEIPGQ